MVQRLDGKAICHLLQNRRIARKDMDGFIAYKLNFTCRAQTTVKLPLYNGSTLRGAFFSALRRDFCLNKNLTSCLQCPAAETCPICKLVSTIDRENERGAEVPRPFALEPVIGNKNCFEAGEFFTFGFTLFGHSLSLFPYAILAVQRMGETGMGDKTLAPGRFLLHAAEVVNPLTGESKPIYSQSTRIVNMPDLAVTNGDVLAYATRFRSDRLLLDLLSPLRLVVEGTLVQKLTFRALMQRLLRRLTDLYRYCCNQKLELDFPRLLELASAIQISRDATAWSDLTSYSSRRRAVTPIGGLTGEIAFTGDLAEFTPLLIWGQITHVGKDATRGNGWYCIRETV